MRLPGRRDAQTLDLSGIDTAAVTETMMSIWMAVTVERALSASRFTWSLLAATSG